MISFRLFTALCFVCLPVLAIAEVSGSASAPAPGEIPNFWFKFGNDFFGIFDSNPDDFRTSQTVFGGRIVGTYALVLDVSNFTNRGPQRHKPDPGKEGRIDQATITASKIYDWKKDSEPALAANELSLGIALRYAGKLNGVAIQNGLHEVINDHLVYLPYERVEKYHAGVYAGYNRHLYPSSSKRWSLWFPVQGIITTEEQAEISAAAYAVAHVNPVRLWTGVRAEARESGDFSRVIDNAYRHEEGFYGIIGMKWGPLALDFGHKFGTTYGYGWLSFAQDGELAPKENVEAHTVAVSMGAELTHFGLRTDLSWLHPRGYLGNNLRWGITGVLTGGQMPNEAPLGWDEYQRGWSLGPQLFYDPNWEGVPWLSFSTNLRYGWRREGFLRSDSIQEDDRFVDQQVLAGDIAANISLSGYRQRGLSLKLGLSGWLPLEGEEIIALTARTAEVMSPQIVSFFTIDYAFDF